MSGAATLAHYNKTRCSETYAGWQVKCLSNSGSTTRLSHPSRIRLNTLTTEKSAIALESTLNTTPRESKADLQALPDHPLVSVRAGGAQAALHLRELWFYRELLYFL